MNNLSSNLKSYFSRKRLWNIPFQLFILIMMLFVGLFNINYFNFLYRDYIDQQANYFANIIIMVMLYWTYFLSSFTKPYQTNLDIALNQNIIQEGNIFELESSMFRLNCQFCKMNKFVRSSHCSTCDICILKRDHHCPFIGNCVGYNNTRYFMNFILWLIIDDVFTLTNFVRYYYLPEVDKKDYFTYEWKDSFIFYFFFVFGILCFIMFIGMYTIQLLLIANDITFLEKIKKPYIELDCCFTKSYNPHYHANEYNKGFLFNYYRIIGPSILHLIFPLPNYKRYSVDECNPAFSKIPVPNSFDIYRMEVKKNNIDKIKEYDDSLNCTNPENFLKLSKSYYMDKFIK